MKINWLYYPQNSQDKNNLVYKVLFLIKLLQIFNIMMKNILHNMEKIKDYNQDNHK